MGWVGFPHVALGLGTLALWYGDSQAQVWRLLCLGGKTASRDEWVNWLCAA